MVEAKCLLPGRELDAMVAEKVMRWSEVDPNAKWDRWEYGDSPDDEWVQVEEPWCKGAGVEPAGTSRPRPFPRYSEKIEAAFDVVAMLRTCYGVETFYLSYGDVDPPGWNTYVHQALPTYRIIASDGVTAAHAICLMALKAVDGF